MGSDPPQYTSNPLDPHETEQSEVNQGFPLAKLLFHDAAVAVAAALLLVVQAS
jgi:hypothetical protein